MVLIQKWPFFQLFFLRIIGKENVFYDILERKNSFLGFKNKKLIKSKNWYFYKGVNSWFLSKNDHYQFGSMPVLEEAKTMVYVTNHNMITMAMVIFKTYKMADKGEEKKEYWPKFSFILVLSSLLFAFLFVSLLWIGKYLEDRE